MKKNRLSPWNSILLLTASMAVSAGTMEVTATFSPSMDNPENNTFTNTTAQSGFCAKWPKDCDGMHSLATGIELTPLKGLTPSDQPRDSLFFKWPSSYRSVEITNNQTGEKKTVKFRIEAFSGNYTANNDSRIYEWGGGNQAFSIFPKGGCTNQSAGYIVGATQVAWVWRIPAGNLGCYGITSVDRPVGDDAFINNVNEISFGYSMIAPNPLEMSAGSYSGSVEYSVGPGGDIDFGDNFQPSVSMMDINFTLAVNHELKLETTTEDHKVALYPCASANGCTEEEGKANWERWSITRITPQLTGKSNFSLSSSGNFTVYLICEHESGTGCAISSDKTGEVVPVKTFLTLPVNITDIQSGTTVVHKELFTGFDTSRNVFHTDTFASGAKGSIDFNVDKRDVGNMLKNAPDTYRGSVTVIFNPKLY